MNDANRSMFKSKDGLDLYEYRWAPPGEPKAGVVIVHGYADHGGRYAWVASCLNRRGYSVRAFDLRGHGRSQGERAFIHAFERYLDDLDTYMARVRSEPAKRPLFLMGHSMGGLIVALHAATRKPDLRGIILSSPLLKVSDKVSPLLQKISGIVGALLPRLAVLPLDTDAISKDRAAVQAYISDPLVYHGKILARTGAEMTRGTKLIQRNMETVSLPLLILHGAADRLCDIRGSEDLYRRSPSADKTLRRFEAGCHELFNDAEKDGFITEIVEWLDARVSA
jgi:alpha-beta hydrolase superfamily lysophospholipase